MRIFSFENSKEMSIATYDEQSISKRFFRHCDSFQRSGSGE